MSATKDTLLLLLGTGGVVAWAKPVKDLITTTSRGRRVKTKDLVTQLNQSRQRADDENEYLREVSAYWQGRAGDLAFTLRDQYGHQVPAATPPERKPT